MQIANIYPVANQELYKDEKYVMILAHLVKKGLYKPENFSEDQYIIMDNGLFEGEQVSTNLEDLIKLAEESGIPVKEIIVPDAVNNRDETKRLFLENLETIKKYNHKYTFMFVAQSLTYHELRMNLLFINQFKELGLKLSVGISKLTPLDRADERALSAYKYSHYPIHILGVKDSFDELDKLIGVKTIRGCDTSQLAYIIKNEKSCAIFPWTFSRTAHETWYEKDPKEVAIDLERDVLDSEHLKEQVEFFWEDAATYGILR